ncbi:MAG: 5-(carboxyamino)imidazole ribonucleotide synthase [Lachnospiraceae bacterium]|nr:5-(carboxyamino)imidazole ribonucleotide synthase [Lachnospiraceae bacterium]
MGSYTQLKKIGIIGGGQLGKMMILEAKKMGFFIAVLDPTENCPAHSVCDFHIIAPFDDREAIFSLAKQVDVITYEFEHIDVSALLSLEKEGFKVYPTAKSLEIIQNKLNQKTALLNNNIPIPEFMKISSLSDIYEAGKNFGFPFMLKSATGGYDGKGNFLINSEAEITLGYETLGSGSLPLMAEKFFPFIMEISVLACRGTDGDIKVYPVGENIHEDNILIKTKVPANISRKSTKCAMELAYRVMEVFGGVGMFCIEMFIDKEGTVAVNEIAPRPHNSGHYTIEACITSQFEQHIRAVAGLPLGSPKLVSPAVMMNILGEGEKGEAEISGIHEALKIEGVTLHIYGKEKSVPKRKMGHLTCIAKSLEEADEKAESAKKLIKIYGKS